MQRNIYCKLITSRVFYFRFNDTIIPTSIDWNTDVTLGINKQYQCMSTCWQFYGLGNCQGVSGDFFLHFSFNAFEIDIIRLPVQRASTKLITLNKTGIPATSQFSILFNPRNLSFQVEVCRNRLCLCKDHRHEGCSSNLNISLGRLRSLFVSKFIPKLYCTLYLRFMNMSGGSIRLREYLWIPYLDMTSFRVIFWFNSRFWMKT